MYDITKCNRIKINVYRNYLERTDGELFRKLFYLLLVTKVILEKKKNVTVSASVG